MTKNEIMEQAKDCYKAIQYGLSFLSDIDPNVSSKLIRSNAAPNELWRLCVWYTSENQRRLTKKEVWENALQKGMDFLSLIDKEIKNALAAVK